MLALIGGTGFQDPNVFTPEEEITIDTPYGAPSAPLLYGKLRGMDCVFLRRHGVKHEYAPHRVPYRANLWALQRANVDGVIAVATVGGIHDALGPGALAVPDQLIDHTWGREGTYFDDFSVTGVRHIDFTHPFDESLRQRLLVAAARTQTTALDHGVYVTTQGPRLETAAEVESYRREGGDMIGMTLSPEAALARELDLPYAALCVSVNYAAGIKLSAQGIDFASLDLVIQEGVARAVGVVAEALR